MPRPPNTNLSLGLGCLAFAAILALVWVPLDVDSGISQTARRRITIGDALAPVVAACCLALGALLLLTVERRAEDQPSPGADALRFGLMLLALIAASLLVMRHAGPLALLLFGPEGAEYRLLRDTAPWKYIGFVVGGTLLVAGLVALTQRRVTPKALIIGVLTSLTMIVVYDLPFNDLPLPPNGDF